jgi:hypothetical protein
MAKRADTYRLAILEEAPAAATPEQSAALDRFLMMAVLRAGRGSAEAHNLGQRGSTPRPATNPAPHGKRCCSGHCRAAAAASSLGTDTATGAQRGTRDGRERPAQPMQRGASGTHGAPHRQAGSTPAPATNLPTGATRQGPKVVKAWVAVPRPENGAAAGPTRDVSDASESSARRDSRERPAPLSAPAGASRRLDGIAGEYPRTPDVIDTPMRLVSGVPRRAEVCGAVDHGETADQRVSPWTLPADETRATGDSTAGDSRERPAPISAPAGATHPPSSSSLPPAGAVYQTAREGRR